MPLFEEKLISPLAIRFTQEHIRPVFQDGRDLEASIEGISTRPGTGDYDLVLEAPFPCIEVVRWSQRRSGSKDDLPDSKDWVTLDNRRLYCLQRAAVALWPRRTAVAVDVLYAATEDILRKCDSMTAGRSVGIGHSLKALTGRWEWREAVALEGREAHSALALIAADAAKTRVEELSDAPAAPSMLDLFLQGADLSGGLGTTKAGAESSSEDSTTMPLSPRSWSASEQCSTSEPTAALDEALVGKWRAEQGESYEITATGPGYWTCRRLDGKGRSQRFPLVYHEPTDAVWWGDLNLCIDASEVRREPESAQWYATSDNRRRRPRFFWQRLETPAAKGSGSRQAKGKRTKETASLQEQSTVIATEPMPRRQARTRRPRAEKC